MLMMGPLPLPFPAAVVEVVPRRRLPSPAVARLPPHHAGTGVRCSRDSGYYHAGVVLLVVCVPCPSLLRLRLGRMTHGTRRRRRARRPATQGAVPEDNNGGCVLLRSALLSHGWEGFLFFCIVGCCCWLFCCLVCCCGCNDGIDGGAIT